MSEDQDKYIAEVVEKALRGDMDAINNIEDRVTRSKAKAALIKAKRLSKTAAAEAAPAEETAQTDTTPTENSLNQKVAESLEKKFSGSIDSEDVNEHIQLNGKNWFEIAQYLKDNPDLLFDSLQCITGFDFGEGEAL